MPLIPLWQADPKSILQMQIEQIVATAGDGSLKDQSKCAEELREYLGQIPTAMLGTYAMHCLDAPFLKSGLVLQDLVNELGRRLDFDVTNGRYQGTPLSPGFDGIWKSPEGQTLVVEVKTTDSYRIALDRVAQYRLALTETHVVARPSSILIVVGRHDTGELEAQVRGSRHAWDMRLISVEALLKLVLVKENAGSADTARQIRQLLVPFEYTKLDNIIEMLFTTAAELEATVKEEDASPAEEPAAADSGPTRSKAFAFTDSAELDTKRLRILETVQQLHGVSLLKQTRATYRTSATDFAIVCTISKRYDGTVPYWYAYHPKWNEFLTRAVRAYVVLGCMDLDHAFQIPLADLHGFLNDLHTTVLGDGRMYWHLKVLEPRRGEFALHRPKASSSVRLDAYAIPLDGRHTTTAAIEPSLTSRRTRGASQPLA
jgi:hypothetical protein